MREEEMNFDTLDKWLYQLEQSEYAEEALEIIY